MFNHSGSLSLDLTNFVVKLVVSNLKDPRVEVRELARESLTSIIKSTNQASQIHSLIVKKKKIQQKKKIGTKLFFI